MAAAGLVGYLMRKQGYSTAAFIIAFVLARGAETAFRQSLVLSDDGWLIFLNRPVAVFFLGLALVVVGSRMIGFYRNKKNEQTILEGPNEPV